jgi:hypothetical protein
MTDNTTPATLDAIDLLTEVNRERGASIRARFFGSIASFAAGLCGGRLSLHGDRLLVSRRSGRSGYRDCNQTRRGLNRLRYGDLNQQDKVTGVIFGRL